MPTHPLDGALPHRIGDEWKLAHSVAELWPGVPHVRIQADHVTPLGGIDRQLDIQGEPGAAPPNYFWLTALLESAQERGVGVLLVGQMGNAGSSWRGLSDRAWHQLCSGRVGLAVKELGSWKRLHGRSWIRAVRSQVVGALVRSVRFRWSAARARSLERPTFSAANPEFSQRVCREAKAAGRDPRLVGGVEPPDGRFFMLQPGRDSSGSVWQELGAAYGMEVRDPTADLQVLLFCLGIPVDQYGRGDWDRWLIRRSLDGLVPPEVQWNRKLGEQAADLGYRLRAEESTCRDWLDLMRGSDNCRDILDLAGMEKALAQVQSQMDPPTMLAAKGVLCMGLGVGRFLLRRIGPTATGATMILDKNACHALRIRA